ncbi:MAG: hypothetical protein HY074_15195 [Deltaproteobacteria bacterium]|nr:hypothetical protein [Deltaproteobacteria bacterium]
MVTTISFGYYPLGVSSGGYQSQAESLSSTADLGDDHVIIVLKQGAKDKEINKVVKAIKDLGYTPHVKRLAQLFCAVVPSNLAPRLTPSRALAWKA